MKLTVRDIAVIAMQAAILIAGKEALAAVPGIEIVTLLIIMFTMYLGKKIFIAVFVFAGVECLIYGIGLWTIMYLYVWPLLALFTWVMRKQDSVWFWSIVSGIYGLCFGLLCSVPYLVVGGFKTALAWWVSGIPYDVAHGAGNFVVTLVLYAPLKNILKRIK